LPLEVVLNEKQADNADQEAAEDGPEEIHLRALAPAEVPDVLRSGTGEFLDDRNQEACDERIAVRKVLGQVADFLDVLQPVVGDASPDRGPRLVVPAPAHERGQLGVGSTLYRSLTTRRPSQAAPVVGLI
jgi:hypothetical protein